MSKVLKTRKEIEKIIKDCQATLSNSASNKSISRGIGLGLQLKITPNQVYYYARLNTKTIKQIGKFKEVGLLKARGQAELLKAQFKREQAKRGLR